MRAKHDNIYLKAGKHLDDKYFNANGIRYSSTAEVLSRIPKGERVLDGIHNVNGIEYWFHTDTDTLELCPGQYAANYDATVGNPGFIEGVPYTWSLKSVIGTETEAPTPPTDAEILANKTYGGYSMFGAKVYKNTAGQYDPDPDVPNIVTPVVWKNAVHNNTDGPMNRCAVWSLLDATEGQYIGFGREVIALTEKVYYIGVGADNYMSIEVNSVVVKTFPSGDLLQDHFESWHLLPVVLREGANIIHVRGYNNLLIAAIGVEIYDATLLQLQEVATVGALDALTIFSTKSLIGSYVEEGNFGTGYTCAEGYTLVNRSGVFSCERYVYGSLVINKGDVVEFRKGTSPYFNVYQDPLDATHKIVETPRTEIAGVLWDVGTLTGLVSRSVSHLFKSTYTAIPAGRSNIKVFRANQPAYAGATELKDVDVLWHTLAVTTDGFTLTIDASESLTDVQVYFNFQQAT